MRVFLLLFVFLAFGCKGSRDPVTADAGQDQVASIGTVVVLQGNGESRNGDPLVYKWHQPGVQNLKIDDAGEKDISFKIPADSGGKTFIFHFSVTDAAGNEATDTVMITVPSEQSKVRIMADFRYKQLLFPLTESHQLDAALDLSLNLVANQSMWIRSVEGASLTHFSLANIEPGDRFDVEVEYVNKQRQLVAENWELYFTSLPVINIRPISNIKDEPKTEARLTLIDSEQSSVFESVMGIEFRGATSQAYTKKSFGIELWKEGGGSIEERDERKIELLGMREDGDWILDAMYIDYGRMRNRVAMDLWNDFSRAPDWSKRSAKRKLGTTGKYVEVLVDGNYHGLYVLSERIDRKQVDINKAKGRLYKADLWGTPDVPLASKFEGEFTDNPTASDRWLGWELKHPKKPSIEAWQPLFELYGFVTSSSDEEFASDVSSWVSIDNMIDYLLFLNLIGGDDNQGKNTFFAIYNVASSEGDDDRFIYMPWDLDATFGRFWNSVSYTRQVWLSNTLFDRLMETDTAEFRAKLKQRWTELRESEFDHGEIMDRFHHYHDHLSKSGALAREVQRWNDDMHETKGAGLDVEAELIYIESWMASRLSWLDDYIANEI